MSQPVRIGAVSYLNTRPLVHGLEHGIGSQRIELSYDVPSVLADRLAAGELEVALLPVVELARIPDLEIVPGLGIVVRGAAQSVLLVSNKPLEQIRRVALDPESRTSNALVQVICRDALGLSPEFVPAGLDLAETLRDHDAAVRIGDKALFEPLPEGVHALDLGEAWFETRKLPFVFAVWAARPGVVDRRLYEDLHDSRREGTAQVDRIAGEFTWQGHTHPDVVRRYLQKHILYRLGSAELESLELFLERCHALGLTERVPPLKLALGRDDTLCHERAAEAGTR